MLELRPAQREPFWSAWLRRPAPSTRSTTLQTRVQQARTGTALGFLRDGARLVRGSLDKVLQLRALRFLSSVFSLQPRIESAFLASGAATQLADAALFTDPVRSTPVVKTYQEAARKLEELYARWEHKQEELASLESAL